MFIILELAFELLISIYIYFLVIFEIHGNKLSEFVCTDGMLIKLEQVCDGIKHCHDGSDETKLLCYHIMYIKSILFVHMYVGDSQTKLQLSLQYVSMLLWSLC